MRRGIFFRGVFLLLTLLLAGSGGGAALADEVAPIRLVALIDRDDQGEGIEFPTFLFYDYWASETYLISSTNRVTIYDQKFFPVASFGPGRGVFAPLGLAVDRQGTIYLCQGVDNDSGKPPRLTIYNQAFFLVKEIFFAEIPELVDFTAHRVALAESGEIYLSGTIATDPIRGVAVLTPEGKFSRFLRPPEKDSSDSSPITSPAGNPGEVADGSPAAAPDDGDEVAGAAAELPAALKPKAASRSAGADEENSKGAWARIADVKIDRQGRIYLLSREVSHTYVLNAREEYLFKFGLKGGADGKLSNPLSLGIDLERRVIYVCDYMRHTILTYDYDNGRFIFEFGGRGLSPLWFNFPNSVEVDQRGRVVVSDLFNRRLQVIDPGLEERRPITPVSPVESSLPPVATASEEPPVAAVPPVSTAPVEPPVAAVLPVQAVPAQQPPWDGMPAGVRATLPPALSALAMGASLAAAPRSPLAMRPLPPERPRPLARRELAPRRLKKVAPPAAPPSAPPTLAAPRPVGSMAGPGPVRFPPAVRAAQPVSRLAEPAEYLLARLRSLPSAVGVYGPVAALLGVGGQLLITNR